MFRNTIQQAWSSRDFTPGLETSQDPFFKVLVLVLNLRVLVLKPLSLRNLESRSWSLSETSESWSWNPWVSVPLSLSLGLDTLESWTWSESWTSESWFWTTESWYPWVSALNLGVLVLVLDHWVLFFVMTPSSLGLGSLGLTSRSWHPRTLETLSWIIESWSWSWHHRVLVLDHWVLVLVLTPSRLCLGLESLSLSLGLDTLQSWSSITECWSWPWHPRDFVLVLNHWVLVLVLTPSSLDLRSLSVGLDLDTLETLSWCWICESNTI